MKKDVLWGYLSQFLQYGAALLVLPLLLRELSSAELGVWYVFMTISTLVSMLDLGFTPTLARNISYVLSGATKLRKDGYDVFEKKNEVDYGLVNVVIFASRRIFFYVSAIATALLLTLGTPYILYVTHDQVARYDVLTAWAIFVFSTATNLFYKYYTPLLQGRGLYAEFYKSSALANIGFVVVSAVLLQLGLGLLAVALGYLVSALLGRWLSRIFLYDKDFKEHLAKARAVSVSIFDVFQVLWYNAWRLGLGVVGAFLILRANTLLCSVYLGLATTASYALTLQVFSVLQNMSTVVFNIQLPKLAQYRLTNQTASLIKTIKIGVGYALGLFIVGVLLLLLLGPQLIHYIGGQTELLALPLLIWVGVMMLLELNHSLAAGVITTGNRVPFVKPALLSGAAIFVLSWIGLKYGGYGLAWLIGSQFMVQLAYNNWQWPLRVYKELSNDLARR